MSKRSQTYIFKPLILNRIKLVISYIFILLISFGCSNKFNSIYPPLNTEKVENNIYIDEFNVTNKEYRDFLYSANKFWSPESSEFLNSLPKFGLVMGDKEFNRFDISDIELNFSTINEGITTIYGFLTVPNNQLLNELSLPLDSIVFGKVTLGTYLNHVVYSDFPVLYITKNQAELYCKWKADMENLRIALEIRNYSDYKMCLSLKSSRLPTIMEWKTAYYNASRNKTKEEETKYQYLVEPIFSKYALFNKKNNYHFYSQLEYLSEMINDNLVISMLSSDSLLTDSIRIQNYSTSSNHLGFRCACEIENSYTNPIK